MTGFRNAFPLRRHRETRNLCKADHGSANAIERLPADCRCPTSHGMSSRLARQRPPMGSESDVEVELVVPETLAACVAGGSMGPAVGQ